MLLEPCMRSFPNMAVVVGTTSVLPVSRADALQVESVCSKAWKATGKVVELVYSRRRRELGRPNDRTATPGARQQSPVFGQQ